MKMKRIQKIVIKRETDTDPDTSYLGEYGGKPTSHFSIDRAHRLDCRSQFGAQQYIAQVYEANGEEAHAGVLPTMDAAKEWESHNRTGDQTCEITSEDAECDCGERSDIERNEYRYFNPNHENYAGEPHTDIVKYCLQDYARMEDYNNQGWCYLLIGAGCCGCY